MSNRARGKNLITVLGSLNADLVTRCERLPRPGETVHGHDFMVGPGGKSANQAVAAARLGAPVVLIGAVGEDAHGRMLLDAVQASGVDTSLVRCVPGNSGIAMITVDAAGENSIIIHAGANGSLTPEVIEPELFRDTAVLCLCFEIPISTVLAAAQTAKAAGALVLLNFSPSPGDADRQLALEVLRSVDVLLVNRHEVADLLGYEPGEDWAQAQSELRTAGLDRVIVTLGSAGSVVLDSTTEPAAPEYVPAYPVVPVDTTGAGDAFTGAVASVLANGRGLLAAAQEAAVAAALSVTQAGAQSSYPRADEVAEETKAESDQQSRIDRPGPD